MSRALCYVAPQQCALRPVDPEAAFAALQKEERPALVRTLWSAISRGTERLVFEGRVPASEHDRMRAPLQDGAFPFPVIYGYAAVGVVERGPAELVGRTVFALAPHQERFAAPASLLVPVPDGAPARRATLGANLETALNGVWDGGAGPGDRIAIVGGGVLGALLAALLGPTPGAEVTLVDPAPERAAVADALGVGYAAPEEAEAVAGGSDLVFHTSATEAGLATALALAGAEAAVVELSWYGDQAPRAPLGEAFHSKRLRLISSQVGQVATPRRARWSHGRRMAKALSILRDPRFDAIISEEIGFDDLPEAMPRVLGRGTGGAGLATVVRYPDVKATD
ncbi:MAG: zinc-binding alcohol dehydrogenase [Pseudomonadota bacterium]